MRKALVYETPRVSDLGDLVELTRATSFNNQEDGGSKMLIHHSSPAGP